MTKPLNGATKWIAGGLGAALLAVAGWAVGDTCTGYQLRRHEATNGHPVALERLEDCRADVAEIKAMIREVRDEVRLLCKR